MLLIHGKEETGQHDGNHSHRRKACACAVFEQKEKRQAEQESRRKTYNLPFGKVERYFCLDFGYFASATGYIAPNQEAYDSAAYKTYREETFPGISVVYDSLAKSDSSATNPYVAISNEMRDANKVAMETAATDPTADINTVITTAKDSIQEALDIYNQSNS